MDKKDNEKFVTECYKRGRLACANVLRLEAYQSTGIRYIIAHEYEKNPIKGGLVFDGEMFLAWMTGVHDFMRGFWKSTYIEH